MAATATRNLFLQISGSTDGLQQAAKAARVSMAELGAASGDLQDVVAENFRKLGGSELAASARQLETSFKKTFADIRAAAEETASKPLDAGGVVSLNVRGAEQALANAENIATTYRVLADAQAKLVAESPAATEAEKRLAVALEATALSARANVAPLEQQLTTLRTLKAAVGGAADSEEELGAAHGRMGSSGLIAEHVVRAFSDSIAAGQSPVRALTLEMGRITEAMTLYAQQTNATEGAMGKFAAFMGGPYGLAISVGVAVLAPLITSLFEAGDAAEKAKKAEQDYAHFQDDLGNFIDGANGKLRERLRLLAEVGLRENAGKIVDAQKTATDLSGQAFAKARDLGGGEQTFTAGGVTTASGDPRVAAVVRQAGGDVNKLVDGLVRLTRTAPELAAKLDPIIHLGGRANFAQQDVSKLQGDQQGLQTLLGGGKLLSSADIERQVRLGTATTPADRAQARLDTVRAQGAEIDKMPYGPARTAALVQFTKDLTAASAALRAIQDAKRDESGYRQIGRQVTLDQAEAIVRGIGGRVTSAERSTEEQARLYAAYKAGTGPLAAKPGTSLHERGEALDIAKGPGISLAALKKAFEDAGVRLTELLDEGNHYHVGFGNKGQARQESEAYDVAGANAKLANATNDVERAEAQLELVRARKRELAPAEYQAALTQAEANLKEARSLDTLREAQTGIVQDLTRRNDAGFKAALPNDFPEVHKELEGLSKGRSEQADDTFRRRASAPLDEYRERLQDGVGDVGRDVSNLEVSAIDHLGQGLESAATKALKLHGILGEIAADLLKMLVQREIELPFSKLLSGGSGGGGGFLSGLGKLFGGGGGNFDAAASSTITAEKLGTPLLHYALGTDYAPGGLSEVGENGPELLNLPRGSQVIPAGRTQAMLTMPSGMRDLTDRDIRALAPQRQAPITLHVEANDYFDAHVSSIGDNRVAVASPRIAAAGASMAGSQAQRARRRSLAGG